MVTHHHEVSKAIEEKTDWVEAVRVTIAEEEAATRAKIESDFRKAKKRMLSAFEAYPRSVSLEAFCYGFDDHFHEKAGHCLRRVQQDIPTKNASNTALECDAKNFRNAAQDLKGNANWVKRIPEDKKLIDVLGAPAEEEPSTDDILKALRYLMFYRISCGVWFLRVLRIKRKSKSRYWIWLQFPRAIRKAPKSGSLLKLHRRFRKLR